MRVVVVGNGIAGITVATKLRELDKKAEVIVISSESPFFFSRPALMYIYMKDMKLKHTQPYEKKFWKKNNIQLIYAHVNLFHFSKNTLSLNDGQDISYDFLVLAVGAKGNMFGWPGQDLKGVQNFTNLHELEILEERTKKFDKKNRVVIVGGGLIGIEVTEMMHRRSIPCSFLVREEFYWPIALSKGESELVHNAIKNHGIDLRLKTELQSINAKDGSDSVTSITTTNGEEITCDSVVISAGVSPNIAQFKDTILDVQKGIIVNRNLQTNIKNVYACGDCAEIVSGDKKQPSSTLELLWYTGKMQGEIVAQNILGENKQYERGIWYNSAKFYDIDYHTYGLVNHQLEGEENFFYRNLDTSQSVRIVYLPKEENRVVGFNFLGLRFRHRICEQWIQERRSFEYVKKHLAEASFEPEFFTKISQEVANV